MNPPHNPLIQLKSITLAHGKTKVLRDFSLHISPGEILGITGANGVGKSTLLKAIAGIHPITSGTILRLPEMKMPGYVPQHAPITKNFPLTVTEFLAVNSSNSGPWLTGIPASLLQSICGKLDCLNIVHLASRPISTLSGGELQRVRIAAALLDDPAIILLDEPSSHLDESATASLKTLLCHLHQAHSLTLVIVSHDPFFLEGLATRRIHIDPPEG